MHRVLIKNRQIETLLTAIILIFDEFLIELYHATSYLILSEILVMDIP